MLDRFVGKMCIISWKESILSKEQTGILYRIGNLFCVGKKVFYQDQVKNVLPTITAGYRYIGIEL